MTQVRFFSPTLNEIYEAILEVCGQIAKRGVKIDLIIGISRGGLIPSRFLSDILNISRVEVVKAEYYTGIMERARKPIVSVPEDLNVKNMNVLIVDDVADTGDTLIEVEEKLMELGVKNVYKATLYVKPWNKAKIDFYSRKVDSWIIFPWEIAETIRVVSGDKLRKVYESLKLPRKTIEKLNNVLKQLKNE